MHANIGPTDRLVRAFLGLSLIIAAFVPSLPLAGSLAMQVVAVAVGLVLLGTALVRICPLYLPFGLSTCKVRN